MDGGSIGLDRNGFDLSFENEMYITTPNLAYQMRKVILRPTPGQKNYTKGLWTNKFPTLLHLVSALFDTYTKGTEDLENIRLLLEETGYTNLKQIPESELCTIKELVRNRLPDWKTNEDNEYLTYMLLSAITKKNILVFVDDQIILDIDTNIELKSNSVISLIDDCKISNITFRTI